MLFWHQKCLHKQIQKNVLSHTLPMKRNSEAQLRNQKGSTNTVNRYSYRRYFTFTWKTNFHISMNKLDWQVPLSSLSILYYLHTRTFQQYVCDKHLSLQPINVPIGNFPKMYIKNKKALGINSIHLPIRFSIKLGQSQDQKVNVP